MHPEANIRWQAYPALLLAGCLAAGIGAAAYLQVGFWVWTGSAGGSLAAAAVIVFLPRRRIVTPRPLMWTFALGTAVLCVGGMLYVAHRALPFGHIAFQMGPAAPGLEPPQATLVGTIAGAPETPKGGVRFTLAVDHLLLGGDTSAVTGKVQVSLYRSRWSSDGDMRPFPELAQGDRVHVTGTLERPPPKRNPATFDYGAYLRRRGIYATLTSYEGGGAVAIRARADRWIGRVVVPARRYVEEQVATYVPSSEARAVLRALLLGDRSRITDTTRERFVQAGLLHLLAVSGLHVLLVGMVLYGLLRPLLMRFGFRWRAVEWVRALVTLALLVFYAMLTGGRASVVRAVVMAGIFMGGVLVQRPTHSLNLLGIAALALLVHRPSFLFDVGFQLSFAAVGAIVAFYPMLRESLPASWWTDGMKRHVTQSLTTTAAAVLGTAPVLLFHFGRVPLAGLVMNLPAIPCAGAVLAAGLALVVTGAWAAPLVSCFGAAADLFSRLLIGLAEVGADWLGGIAVDLSLRDPWWLLAVTGALLMLVQWRRPRLRWRLCVMMLVLANLGLWTGLAAGTHVPRFRVIFFDVGQGDAALVSLSADRHVLIDAGPRTPFSSAAEYAILPYLERRGIDRLDAVVISHSDRDHLGGLPALLRSIPVERVIRGGDHAATNLYAEVQHLLDSLDTPQHIVQAGDTLRFGPAVQVRVLAPFPGAARSDNAASVVLHVAYGQMSALFLGDAERWVEQKLVARYGPLLDADVIKAGHHGSSTSSTLAFVQQATSDDVKRSGVREGPYVVVSVGRSNRFGLPSPRVMRRWRSNGARVLMTAQVGAVWLESNGRRFKRVDWR